MAHKEEFKHDVVRESLVTTVEFVKKNKNRFLQYTVIILLVGVALIFYSNHKNATNLTASVELGKAVNLMIDGNEEVALLDIQSVADNYDGTPAAAEARIYLIQDAIKRKDYDRAKEEIDYVISEIEDPVILASMWAVKGDLAFNDGDYDEAIRSYKKAAGKTIIPSLADSYDISIVRVHMAKGELAKAKELLESLLDKEDLRFNLKNEAEDLLAEVKFRLK